MEPVGLKVQTPDSFKTIGNMLNFATGAQNLQRGKVELEQNQIKLQERKAIQQLFSNPQQFIGADGTPDFNKLIPSVLEVAPTSGPEIIPRVIQGFKDSAEAQKSLNALNGDQLLRVGNFLTSLADEKPESALSKLDALGTLSPGLKPAISMFRTQYLDPSTGDAAKFKQALMQGAQSVQTLAEQRAMKTPAGPQVTNNVQTGTMNLNPQAPGGLGIVPESVVNQQLPLGDRQVVQNNPLTGAPQTIAKDAFGNVQGVTQTPVGQGVPQLGPGGPQAAASLGTGVGENWKTVTASAERAAQDVGVLQEIKKYAPGAVAGVIQDRRSFLAGLAGLIGMDVGEMTRTKTDMLAKNSNMLALAGGDTDLARRLAETANPNVKMTKGAILAAANQVIGQRQLAIERQRFLSPYLNDPAAYNEALVRFNSVADPRILQLPNMDDAEKIEMKNAMSPTERKAFGEKIRLMQQMGILR